ncbi:hypothetical protein BDZ97DRAFT_1920912 [Flammula alnicola]|nr:hypothetical protein BDZ97DRAFT_1920912 [Flammula alnicola]
MALETASRGKGNEFDIHSIEASNVPPQYERLKSTWESFIDSVMREWKTFNIISVLLLSAILTILQIQSAAADPVTRYAAIFSLICALISLLFGCMYIIRFGSMRKTYKAAEWALEAKKTKTVIWWNVWVLLAMPAIWLTWSIILYIACIMSFIWRTSTQDNGTTQDLSNRALLTIRIVLTVVLGLGLVYGGLILSTFSRYGEAMDRAWKRRIDGWMEEKKAGYSQGPFGSINPYYDPSSDPASYFGPGWSQPTPYGQYQSNVTPYIPPLPELSGQNAQSSNKSQSYGPIYASASYVPPPEPYDSRNPSRASSSSDESTSSTLYATRSNTLHNKTSGLQREDSSDTTSPVYKGPGYTSDHPLPQPPQPLQTPPFGRNDAVKLGWKKTTLAVPPPPSLPPIPGTPMTAVRSRNSGSSGHQTNWNDDGRGGVLGLDLGERVEDTPENRVRFRSPLISARGSSFWGSDQGGEDPGSLPPSADTEAFGSSVRLATAQGSDNTPRDNDAIGHHLQ